VRHEACAGQGAALFERSEFAARPEHALLPHLIAWMVAQTTHPGHRGFSSTIDLEPSKETQNSTLRAKVYMRLP